MEIDYGDNILNIAASLFKMNGLYSTTMDDIAHEMRISKKTIYKKYKSKKEILIEISVKYFKDHTEQYENLENSKNAADELLLMIQNLSDLFSDLHPRMIYELKKYYPEIWELFVKHSNNVILKKITQNLKRGIEEGIFRQNINCNLVAKLTLTQIQLIFDPNHFPKNQYPTKEILQQFVKMYLNGISKSASTSLNP